MKNVVCMLALCLTGGAALADNAFKDQATGDRYINCSARNAMFSFVTEQSKAEIDKDKRENMTRLTGLYMLIGISLTSEAYANKAFKVASEKGAEALKKAMKDQTGPVFIDALGKDIEVCAARLQQEIEGYRPMLQEYVKRKQAQAPG